MNGGTTRRDRRWARGVTAFCLGSVASGAWAQAQPEPLPPPPDTTTIQEPPAPPANGETPAASPLPEEKKVEEPKHSPPNAGGIPLSTIETDNQLLLYFDPV